MQWTSRFQADPIGEIAHWSDMRWPWALIIFLSCALVVLAHNVFQVWLYMKPCEQCVYIRFGFLVIALGGGHHDHQPEKPVAEGSRCRRRDLRLHLRPDVLAEVVVHSPRDSR